MKILLSFLLVLLTGCATGPLYQAPPAPPPDYATLIIYRESTGFSQVWASDFSINSKEDVASLREEGYTVITLKTGLGKHAIRRGSPTSPYVLYLDPIAGQTYYVKYAVRFGSLAFAGGTPMAMNTPDMRLMSAQQGAAEIVKYKLQPAAIPRIDDLN